MTCSCILIVIVISKFLKRHSKANPRASAYSRALHQITGVVQSMSMRGSGPVTAIVILEFVKEVVQRIVHGKLRWISQMILFRFPNGQRRHSSC